MSDLPLFSCRVRYLGRWAAILLAGLIIVGCEKAIVASDTPLSVIDHAATDFAPDAFIIYYGVTVTPSGSSTVDSVTAELYLRAGEDTSATDSLVESVSLVDDGTGGDIIPADDVYGLAHTAPFTWGTEAEVLVIYRAYISGAAYTLRDSLMVSLPVMSEIVLSYDKIENEIFCSVFFTSPTDNPVPDTIRADFFSATGIVADSAAPGTLLISKELFDNQTDGDVTAGDGIYTRVFESPFAEPITGKMKVLFVAYIDGDIYTVVDTLKLSNQLPVIDTVTVDTIVTRPTGSNLVANWIYIDASDPDGLEDLQSVTFQIMKPDTTLGADPNTGNTVFQLYDDGVNNPYDARNDVTPGDGRYSGGITFGSVNPLGIYQLMFVAKDYSNETSDTVKVNVVLQ